jgi:hypothetical protein
MSERELNALERDVEQARAKFAIDLARLRSPANLAQFKDDLRATKDELLDTAKEAAEDRAQRLFAEVKGRIAANPLATMAIGAGLAWRLVHRPPIATVLVGLGLLGLARTAPSRRGSQPYMGWPDEDPVPRSQNEAYATSRAARKETFADAAKEIAENWRTQAGDVARETAAQIADKVSAVTEVAAQKLHDARDTAGQFADQAGSAASQASQTLRASLPEPEERDAYLLGAAALAVAAAVGIAYQRRDRRQGYSREH